jgi:hypothetical protein
LLNIKKNWFSGIHVTFYIVFGHLYSHLEFGLKALFRKFIPRQGKIVTPYKGNEASISINPVSPALHLGGENTVQLSV